VASTPVTSKVQRRRTQAERSATTQEALLDATIACVVEYGYVNTTTSRVAERAGVSRGAQVHHFPTKSDLVYEAVGHLARRRVERMREGLANVPAGPERIAGALDLLWREHTGPMFDASLELWVASRTDPRLRSRMADFEREVASASWMIAAEELGPVATDPEFHYAMDVALATMRGYALLRGSRGEDSGSVERRWAAARPRLLALFPAG
jgi:AcrR family transcriptional regulator